MFFLLSAEFVSSLESQMMVKRSNSQFLISLLRALHLSMNSNDVFGHQNDSTKAAVECSTGQRPTVGAPPDGALLELHDVLGQSPRLVGEDVLDLAQLLVQRGGPSLRGEKAMRTF